MSSKQQRDFLRIIHLLTGIFIGFYIYSPIGSVPIVGLIVKVVIIPLLTITGLVMWQMPRLRKWMKGS